MNPMPIIIMNSILFIISVLLSIADRLLVSYGECKIIIEQEDEKKEFLVHGGAYLISYLIENQIPISASCGGKATCGYCKIRVLEGGGQILPTEEIFMSREEILEGMRLACQVKVKNDIEIFIPDFLTTVKTIVKNEMYDPKLKWQFAIAEQTKSIPADISIKKKVKVDPAEYKKVQDIIEGYSNKEGALMHILHEVNNTFKYLPEFAFELISKKMDIPSSKIFRIATFFNAFSLTQRGKYVINVCLGTACYVKSGQKILEAFKRELDIKVGETTDDMKFSLKTVNCLGCCGQSPAITVNEDIYGYVKQTDIPKIIKQYE